MYAVPPLPLVDSAADIDAVLANDAVALFAARARAATGDFTLDASDASTVADICARLDGLPLAIELAAARVPVLPPKAILRRLDQRLPLLTGGRRDQDERQRTLRATIEWSYELLTPAEQRLFARLGVFVGGCRLNAAESVCDPDRELGIDVVDGISSLLHKSLLRRRDDPDGEPRFSMLETIREYAEERLNMSEEADSIRNRAIDAAVDFAIAAEPGWRSPDGSVWRRRFPLELSNLRQAMALAHTAGTPERALVIASHLTWLWQMEGFVHEGIELVERALAECGGQLNAESKGLALACIGVLASDQGDMQRAFPALEEASPLLKPTRPDLWVYLQYRMARLCALTDPDRAALILVGADEEAEALDDDLLRVAILEARASLAAQHDLATARVLASTGVNLARAHHPGAHLSLLAALADYEAADGDYDSARGTVEEAEAVAEREQLSWELARVYRVAALIAIIADDLPEAIARRDRLAEYVASSERLPDRLALALVEAGLAAKARTPREAIVAWAHADSLRDSLDLAWEAMEKQLVERVLEPLRQQVPEADFREAWEAACSAKEISGSLPV